MFNTKHAILFSQFLGLAVAAGAATAELGHNLGFGVSSTSSSPLRHQFVKRGSSNSTTPKLVFAHFIAGLTINYTRTDWLNQINMAATHGIDAFALNVGAPDSWQIAQVTTAYDLAGQTVTPTGQPFKLFLSLDMSVIKSANDVTAWVTKFLSLPSQLTVGGRPLVSTFAGEDNMLGGASLSAGWKAALKDPLLALNPSVNPLFVPVWSSLDPNTAVSNNPVVDGIMTWKSWPSGPTESSTTVTDLQFQADAQKEKKLYMAGVSPCFYTHYPDKNYLFRSDDNLYIKRWQDLIAMPTQPDFVQIISWNDYGESHYIGPVTGTQPNGTTWVDGFDHQAWLDMTDYFITWYKTGAPPPINEDKVYFNYRPHSVSAVASSDPLGPPANASLSTDAIYASTFLGPSSAARKLEIRVGGVLQSFTNLTAGAISTFSAPWNGTGGDVEVDLLDGSGTSIMQGKGTHPISNIISTYNFNYAHEKLTQAGIASATKSSAAKKRSKSSAARGETTSLLCTILVPMALFMNNRLHLVY